MTAALGCGICGAMEDGMTVRATRYISATRCACILMLEDILAPILAFAVYGEMPSRINVIQSSVLFGAALPFACVLTAFLHIYTAFRLCSHCLFFAKTRALPCVLTAFLHIYTAFRLCSHCLSLVF